MFWRFVPDYPLNTDTRIIWTLWHVLFVSVLIRVPLFLFLSTRLFLKCKWEICLCCRFIRAELCRQIKGTVTKSFRYQFIAPVHTNPNIFETTFFFYTNRMWMNERIHWFSVGKRPKKIYGFINIRICMDRALPLLSSLVYLATLYTLALSLLIIL